MREKLIELLMDMPYGRGTEEEETAHIESVADYLIENGVTVTDNNVGSKWIPVTERLPDSGKCVLIYSEDGMVAEGNYTAYDKKWYQFRWSVKGQEVTHWMPLPEPPKGE